MPARLYPKDGPSSKVSHGECAVYRALAAGGLPDGWTAWHSLRLRVGNGWEGEGDFVFANPKRGHTDIMTTMRYAHLSPETRRDAVVLLDVSA